MQESTKTYFVASSRLLTVNSTTCDLAAKSQVRYGSPS